MITIKRYSNRKLYNTQTKQYITLDGIAALVRDEKDVQIIDHESGEDLTAITLAQIFFEKEKFGKGIFTSTTLRRLIQTSEDRVSQLRNALFGGPTPDSIFQKELGHRLDLLTASGEFTDDEAQAISHKLIDGANQLNNTPPSEIPEDLSDDIEEHVTFVKEELARLFEQLDHIMHEVEDLKSKD